MIALVATSGVAVIYVPQPIQTLVAAEFGIAIAASAAANVAVQAGYALGVFFLVSLSDRFSPRSQVTVQLIATAGALTGAALAPTHELYVVMCFVAGATATVGQILIASALRLVPPESRARVVAILIGSFLVGLFTVRTALGALAEVVGWRGVVIGMVLVLLALVPLSRYAVPHDPREAPPAYRAILRSIPGIALRSPALRTLTALHALTFAVFISAWSLSTVHAVQSLGLSVASSALVGLAGLAGGAATIVTAPLHSRVGVRHSFTFALLALIAGAVLLAVAPHSIVVVIVGLFLLSFGLSAGQVSTQARALASVGSDQGGRANTVYVTATFLGGALATAAAENVYQLGGFAAVSLLSLVYAVAAIMVLGVAVRRRYL